jgi:hypothetical protein|uniref:Uncharacterized protein n=1 Tax=Siphoviridae sp. ctCIv11 TaxID=2827806 RepID=A0A8S5S2H8_9CAUD|nr:MAG TPA: hypothetical protein [Siphoviridae sp. ctCIv11]
MSIASGFTKMKNYILTSSGYKLLSRWTSSQTVHMGDGTDDTDTVEHRFGAMKGVTSSLATDNDEYALSASAGKNLQDQCTQLNQSLTYTTSQDVVIGSLNGKELHRHVYNIIKSDNLQTMTIDTGIKSGDIDCMINIYGTYKASNGVYYVLSPQSSLRCEVVLSSKGVELIIKGINAVKVTAVIEYTLA